MMTATTRTTTSSSNTITGMMMMMLTTTTPTTSTMTAATNKQHQKQRQQKKQQHRYEWHLKKMETSSQKHSLACNLILLLIFSCWLPDFIMGLKDVTVTIPQAVKRGSNALLTCNYDMENDTLYSVKWYKGRREFYRYTPKENPAMKVFPGQAGLIVERNLSNQSHVVLLTVPLTVSGKFTCEISVEAPSFQTAMVSGEMEIVELPVEQATVTGIQPRYRIGDLVDGNCSIKFSKPAANLTWTINGIVVPPHHIKTYQIEKYEENNLESVLSAIHFMVTTQHFVKGQMRLKCTATIFDIFKEEIESIIEEDRPRIMASGRSYDMHNYPYDPHGHGEGGYEDHNESYLTYYSAADISSGAAAAALPTLPSVSTLIAVVVVASVCNIYKNYLQQYVHEIYDKFYTLLTHSLKAHHQMLTTFVINLSLWWWRCCASRTNGNGISNYGDNNVKKRQDTSAQGQQHKVAMTTVHNLSSYHRMAAVVFTVEFLFLWLRKNKTSGGQSMRVNEMQNNCSSVELKPFKKEKHIINNNNNNNNKSYKCNCKRVISEKEEEKCCEKQNEHEHKQQQHNGRLYSCYCCCRRHLKISSYYREQQEHLGLEATAITTTTTTRTTTIEANQKAVNDLLNTVTTKLETVINLTHIDCQQLSQTYGTNANITTTLTINHTNTNAPYTVAKVIMSATLMSYVVRVESFLTFKTIRTTSAIWLLLLLLFLLYLELPCKNGNDNDNDEDDDDDDDDSDSSNFMSKDQTLLMTTPTTTVVGVATHCQHRQQQQQQLKDALTTTNTSNHMIPSLSSKQAKYYQATKVTATATATTLHVFTL